MSWKASHLQASLLYLFLDQGKDGRKKFTDLTDQRANPFTVIFAFGDILTNLVSLRVKVSYHLE